MLKGEIKKKNNIKKLESTRVNSDQHVKLVI
jgi:hypothetical protein